MTTSTTRTDLVKLLLIDHKRVEALLAGFDGLPAPEVPAMFWQLTNELVRHESAEELVLYPALRSVPGGDVIATSRIGEQAEAERLMAKMEKMDAESGEFAEAFSVLASAVLRHAASEESDVFPLVERSVSTADRAQLGRRYQEAKEVAPTHPHPRVPDTPPGNTILGPIAGLVDKLRDAFHEGAGHGAVRS